MKKHRTIIITAILLSFLSGSATGWYIGWKRGIPFVKKERTDWAIGIFTGSSPFSLTSSGKAKNPVLTANDVTDIKARFVADPFMVQEKGTWYMFFEVLNEKTNHGDIAFAISGDGFNWSYQQTILDEPFHLSYPYVFKWQNEYYMVPETKRAYSVRLYKAVNFPSQWSFVKTLIDGVGYLDPSIFFFDSRWWLFAASGKNDILHLHYADELKGPWTEHPESPVIEGNANKARPGGRVLVLDGGIVRYAQDDYPGYGNQVRAIEIRRLTTTSYEEKEMNKQPVTKPRRMAWNSVGMHHIDAHQLSKNEWIAAVDGFGKKLVFGLKY